jgi:DNA polymerase III delta prime subunit
MSRFHPASRPSKLNIAFFGPSGAGKTYTALALAHQLGSRVALVDTEHESSALYAGRFPHDVVALDPPFHPERYAELLAAAVAEGYDVVILDSLSPEWDGPGGCLALVADVQRQQKTPNSFTAWAAVTPRHDALFGAINRAPCSVIGTFRAKPAYDLVPDGQGRTKPVRRALPGLIGREEGAGFEWDLLVALDAQHRATPVKSRFLTLPTGRTQLVDAAWLQTIAAWRRAPQPV